MPDWANESPLMGAYAESILLRTGAAISVDVANTTMATGTMINAMVRNWRRR